MAVSGAPYKVTLFGRAGILYSEGQREVHIDSEMLAGGEFDVVVFINEIKAWDYPNDGIAIGEEDKNIIKDRVSKKLGRVRVDWK